MTLQKLASAIAKREGKKSQARIGDIREILKIICVLEAEAFDADTPDEASGIGCLAEQAAEILRKLRKPKQRAK